MFWLPLAAFLFSFSFVFVLTPFLRSFAISKNIVDAPDGKIKHQKEPVAYLGGVTVYLGLIFSSLLFLDLHPSLLFFFLGLTLLLVLGLVDDVWVTTPYQKFLGQMVAAASFLVAGLSLKEAFLSSWENYFLSFFWILSVVNAFNLVDVMDGLATLLAICATISFLLFSFIFSLQSVSVLLALFLGSLLGFFYYNKPPARMYLGDAGALFIGGFLAIIPFFFNWGFHSFNGFLAPCVVLALPLLESFSLIVIRTYQGKPFYYGSPDHYCHYLLAKGWRKKEILLFSTAVSLVLFFVASFIALGALSVVQIALTAFLGTGLLGIVVFSSLFSRKQQKKSVAFYRGPVAKGKDSPF